MSVHPSFPQVDSEVQRVIDDALSGAVLSARDGYTLINVDGPDLKLLLLAASQMARDARPDSRVTYSRKVFLPLTNLCRDRCGYCTFVKGPSQLGAKTMTPDEVLDVARLASEMGCKEVLFSLGDHPEWRHPEMKKTLEDLGYSSTPEYVAAMSRMVFEETGLLPHTNCGILDRGEIESIAPWNASMGIMLENVSDRLLDKGEAHYQAASKVAKLRISMLELAGSLGVAMTSGILIGIGERLHERVDSLIALRDVHDRWGNIQEIIIQNFRAKEGTTMRNVPEPSTLDMLRTQATARLVMGPSMNIESPPNLNRPEFYRYLEAGINDWGGISPLTKDFINPEAPWPEIEILQRVTEEQGYTLRERATLFPEYVLNPLFGLSPVLGDRLRAMTDDDGLIRSELERW